MQTIEKTMKSMKIDDDDDDITFQILESTSPQPSILNIQL